MLSKVKKGEHDLIPKEIGNSFVFSLFLTLPASVGLVLVGRLVLDSIYFGGRWDTIATETTILPLGFYALAIPFYSLNKIMISCYYAFQDTKTPLRVQAFTFIFSLLIAISLIESLKHGSIAFASACSSFATSIILFITIKKHNVHIPLSEVIPKIAKILIPLTFLFLWIYLLDHFFYDELLLELKKQGLSHANSSRILLAIVLSSGMLGYFVVAYYVGVEECKTIFGKFLR